MNIMKDLHALGLNPFAVTLLAESLLKSPVAPMSVDKPLAFFFPIHRGDCEGWSGAKITLEAVRAACECRLGTCESKPDRRCRMADEVKAVPVHTTAQTVPAGIYSQPVPDHCDRITWRGRNLGLEHVVAASESNAATLLSHLKTVLFHLRRGDFNDNSRLQGEAEDRIQKAVDEAAALVAVPSAAAQAQTSVSVTELTDFSEFYEELCGRPILIRTIAKRCWERGAAIATAAAIPTGYWLAPDEATPTQIEAAHNGPLGAGEYAITDDVKTWLKDMYATMRAAHLAQVKEQGQ